MTTECPSNYKTIWEITSTGSAISTLGMFASIPSLKTKTSKTGKIILITEAYGTLFLAVGLLFGYLEYTDNT